MTRPSFEQAKCKIVIGVIGTRLIGVIGNRLIGVIGKRVIGVIGGTFNKVLDL